MSHKPAPIASVVLVLFHTLMGTAPLFAQNSVPKDDDAAKRQQEQQHIRTLTSSDSWADRDKACRELQIIGSRACIPALATLLTDKKLSHCARCVLEAMSYPEAGRALREALGKTQGREKVGIIHSLGFRRDEAAVPMLTALLTDGDPMVVGAAATALGQIGALECVDALAEFRADAPASLQPVATKASLRLAQRLLSRGESDAAAQIYLALEDTEGSESVRLGVFVGLLRARPEEAASRITAALSNKDLTLRAVAIAGIGELEENVMAERFTAELPKLPPSAQVLLIDALAVRCPATARSTIFDTGVTSSDDQVRAAAAVALGQIGDASCTDWLAEMATGSSSEGVAVAAVNALRILEADGVGERLTHCMINADSAVRPTLIELLSDREETGAADALVTQAEQSDTNVRRAAFKALAELAAPTHLPRLIGLLVQMSADDPVRNDLERAVGQIAGKIPDESKRADAVLATLAAQRKIDVRCSLLRVLASIGGPEALAVVRNSLQAADEKERDEAVRALTAWPDTEVLETVHRIFDTTENRIHRVLALRGIVRLLSPPTDVSIEETVEHYRDMLGAVVGADEKKTFLAGLMHVIHPDALTMATEWLEDKAVAEEAAMAAINIAENLIALRPDAVTPALKRIAAVTGNAAVKKKARKLLRQSTKFEDYIVAWRMAGPYRIDGKGGAELFGVPFPPEKAVGADSAWLPLPPRGREEPWMLNLGAILGGNQCLAYVTTWIHSDVATPAVLEMGVDDGIGAWLNGKVIHANNDSGAAVPGEEKVELELPAGWSRLVLKIIQHTGPWEFCARLVSPDGKQLKGITVDPRHQGPTRALPPMKASANAGRPRKSVKRRKAAAPTTPAAPLGAAGPPPTGNEPGWQSLFNGKDLSGWKKTGNAIVSVRDGCLVGTQTDGKGGDLWRDGEWSDFELRVTYRVKWPANTGFWFRHDGRKGYQFDVLKWKKPVAFSGTLYCPGKMFITKNLNESLEKRDDWNEAAIRARGDELTLWLNGTLVGHCRDSTHKRGKIGVQVHGGDRFKGMEVAVKSIEIRELPPQASNDSGSIDSDRARAHGAKPSPLQFVMHRVGEYRSEACDVGDVNNDGKLDIVAGPNWYEAPNWTTHEIREMEGDVTEEGKGYRDDFMNILLDVDQDGLLDLVTCCWFAKQMRWYRNPGAKGGPWPITIVENNGNYEMGDLWDVDGDGKKREIVPATKHTAWFEVGVGKDGKPGLIRHDVSPEPAPWGNGVGDVNGDGRPDILRPNAWFEAPADPRKGTWAKHTWAVGAKEGEANHTPQILVYDVDGDGSNDVVTSSAHKRGIFWYQQVKKNDGITWKQHQIDDTWSQAHSLTLADVDEDGDLDLVTGKRFMAHNGKDPGGNEPLGVYWYELERDPEPRWIKHVISYGEGIGSGFVAHVVDLDADRDLDIVTTGKWAGPVWFENKIR